MVARKHNGAGLVLKSLQWILRFIEFLAAAVVLALFSYFLAKLSSNHLDIPTHMRAIEGISGAAVLYTIIAVLLVCFIGGLGFFALLAFILDICFAGAFIWVAYENHNGANSCNGNVDTWLGSGDASRDNMQYGSLPSLKNTCRMETAVFAVSIVAILFFILSAFVELALWRHHKAEKAYGPSPANNYTAGTAGRRHFWQRRRANRGVAVNDNALPPHTTPADVRTSYATENTMVGNEPQMAHHSKFGTHGHNNNMATNGAVHADGYPRDEYGNTLYSAHNPAAPVHGSAV